MALERAEPDPFVARADANALVGHLFPAIETRAEMNAHGQFAFAMQLAVDVQLQIVRHVADVRDAELANLSERILCLLHATLAREGARDDGVEETRDAFAAHVAVEAALAVSRNSTSALADY